MANPGNLKPFRPGRSGNPGGRPKSRMLTDRLRDAVEAVSDGRTVAEQLIDELIRVALKGDRQAIKDIFERLEGKVAGPADDEDDDERPVSYGEFKAALREHRARKVQS